MTQPLTITSIKTAKVRPGDNYTEVILVALDKERMKIADGDIFVITSKIVSLSEENVVKLSSVRAGPKAKKIAQKDKLDARMVELVLKQSEEFYGVAAGLMVTRVCGMLQANGGIDKSNIPDRYGSALLYPKDPDGSARKFRAEIRKRTGKNVGVIISDSSYLPLRKGSIGMALGIAGFNPLKGDLAAKDVFGHSTSIGQANPEYWWIDAKASNVADGLAAAAGVILGETDEQTPVAVIRGARVELTNEKFSLSDFESPPAKCPIMSTIAEISR